MSEPQTSDYVEDLAATMLTSTLGIEFNPDAAWDERKRVYEMSNLIVTRIRPRLRLLGRRAATGRAWSRPRCSCSRLRIRSQR